MVLSVSKQEAVTFTIPWLCPAFYFPTSLVDPSWLNSMIGIVDLTEMAPLTAVSEDTTDTIMVTVFARFTEPQVAGYVIGQSEAVQKTIKGVFKGVQTAKEVVKAVFDIAPNVTSLIGSLAAFDKPLSVAALQPLTTQFSRGMALGDGLDTSQSLSIDPTPKVSTEGFIVGNLESTVPLLGVICTPMLRQVATFNSISAGQMIEPITPIVRGVTQPDYLSYTANMFRYWRGSIKYCLQFFTSPLLSARFRISVLYSPLVDINAVNDSGDIVSKVVDVKGDTTVTFTVPYLWDTPYRETYVAGDPDRNLPLLTISALSPVVSTASTEAFIYCCLWRSAGEDFQFLQYTSPKLPVSGQANPVELFKSPFTNILGDSTNNAVEHHYVSPERVNSLNELWHRFSTTASNNTIPGQSALAENLQYWCKIFKHWRGSRRLKILYDGFDVQSQLPGTIALAKDRTAAPTTAMGDGMALTCATFPWLEVEVPYYSTVAFKLVFNNGAFFNEPVTDVILTGVGSLPIIREFWAGGDDFTLGYLYPPPLYDTAP